MRQMDVLIAQAPKLKIGLVQPNIPLHHRRRILARRKPWRELTALQEQTRRLQRGGAQLVVWSEGSYPVALPRDFIVDFTADSPAMIRRGIKVPLMIGASMDDSAHDDAFNSALLFDDSGQGRGPLR